MNEYANETHYQWIENELKIKCSALGKTIGEKAIPPLVSFFTSGKRMIGSKGCHGVCRILSI